MNKKAISSKSFLEYQLPIKKEYLVRVVTDESPAHKDSEKSDLTNAIDFLFYSTDIESDGDIERRFPIYAPAKGKVVKVVRDKREGGSTAPIDDAGNELLIEAGEGEEKEFYHLGHFEYNSIPSDIKEGTIVEQGTLLGYINNKNPTGFSILPHSHFSVGYFDGKKYVSKKIRWKKGHEPNLENRLK